MEELKERIKSYLTISGITLNKIAKDTGYPQSNLQKQINGETTMSVATLMVIANYLPDLSMEWLIRGTGEMTRHENGGKTINVYRQGGNGSNQKNIVSEQLDISGSSDSDTIRLLLEQNQKLIDALIQKS